MLRNTFTNRLLLVTAVLCTASLLFFANACNEKLGVVDADKGFPAESITEELGQGYLIGFHGEPDEELIRNVGGRILRAYSSFPILHIDVPEHAVQELRDNPNVRHLVRNTLLTVERSDVSFMDLKGPGFGIASEPEPECDVDSYKRYNGKVLTDYIDLIGAPRVWDRGIKGQGIRVAILDSGIDDSHPDLTVNRKKDHGFTKYETGHPRLRPWYFDTEGWGTLKAGVIGAHGESHLLGVAPEVELISVKIMMNAYPMEWVIDGIDWCIDFNKLNEDDPIRIMYMGFGYYQNDMDEEENFERYNALLGGLINEAYNDGGMLIVASAGNIFDSGVTKVRYPAAFDNVIAVSAANAAVDGLSAISRFGTEIELIAPGENIYTTSIENARYECREGTAYSAGFVAGAAALVWSAEPGLTNKQVRDILTGNTEWIVGLDEGQQGNGLVRVDLALGIVPPPPGEVYTINATAGDNGSISPSGYVGVNEGASQTFTIIADGGYQIDYVLVDDFTVGSVSSYTFNNVTADHSIHAEFEEVPPVETYTITASAGTGGTIDPSGDITVSEGANQMFTIAASSGFQISDVLVDSYSVGAVSNYTFENVTANHEIEAVFEETESMPLSIDWFHLKNTSNPQWARVTVDWEVSGEDLETVTLEISGPGTDDVTFNVSGHSASGTHEFSFRRGWGTYSVILTVTDKNGTAEETKSITL